MSLKKTGNWWPNLMSRNREQLVVSLKMFSNASNGKTGSPSFEQWVIVTYCSHIQNSRDEVASKSWPRSSVISSRKQSSLSPSTPPATVSICLVSPTPLMREWLTDWLEVEMGALCSSFPCSQETVWCGKLLRKNEDDPTPVSSVSLMFHWHRLTYPMFSETATDLGEEMGLFFLELILDYFTEALIFGNERWIPVQTQDSSGKKEMGTRQGHNQSTKLTT